MARDYENYSKDALIVHIHELEKQLKNNKYGLHWDKSIEQESVIRKCKTNIPVLKRVDDKCMISDIQSDTHIFIEGDNFHALTTLNMMCGNVGDIVCDYLNPKKLLDTVRLLCRGKKEPVLSLCRKFNVETDDGRNMQEVSELLNDAINSIIDVKEDSDIDSLFSAGGTSALMSEISGLDDFELICFLVVK